jgi:hypothetical protein
MPRVRMSGAVPLLPLNIFVVWTRRTLVLLYFFVNKVPLIAVCVADITVLFKMWGRKRNSA